MTNSSAASASSSVVNVHWPLYTVYPAAIVFFYCAYFLFIPLGIRLCCQKRFNVLTRLNKRCFIQNINSCLHAFAIVSSLFIVLAGDLDMRAAGVAPHYNVLAYCEVCVSLGYMSFVLPWSLHMYFGLKARRPYTSATFCVHHATVVVAEVVYLLTQTCALHGALTVALMEFTNWFFLPLILMTQLDIVGLKKAIAGALFVVVYTVCRMVLCVWVGIDFAIAAARYEPDGDGAGAWAAVAISLLAFWVLLGLSVYWWCRDVPPGIKAATEDMWGEGYWKGKWWCPWFCQEEEREKRRERRRRRAALNELKRERDAEMKKADVQIVSRTFDGGQSSA